MLFFCWLSFFKKTQKLHVYAKLRSKSGHCSLRSLARSFHFVMLRRSALVFFFTVPQKLRSLRSCIAHWRVCFAPRLALALSPLSPFLLHSLHAVSFYCFFNHFFLCFICFFMLYYKNRGAGDVSRETLRNVDSVSRETELDCVELATVFHGFFDDDPTDRPRKIGNRANSVLIPLRGLMPLLRVIWWRSPNADAKASIQGFTALIRGYFWTEFGTGRRFHGKEQSG